MSDHLTAMVGLPAETHREARKLGIGIMRQAAQRHGCPQLYRDAACLDKRHRTDDDWARELLQALGIIPTDRVKLRTYSHDINLRAKGRCPVCHRLARVNLNGRLGTHNKRCHGAGARPEPLPELPR